MLLQVHDELVFEVPPDEKEALATIVREEMEGALTLAVPLKADLAIGPNWLDTEPLGA
jgi:DNA polymerase-1